MGTMIRVTGLVLLVLMLAGCQTRLGQWFRGADAAVDAPAALVDFEPTLRVERLWRVSAGRGERRLGLRIAPTLATGRLYVVDPDGALQALDATTGTQAWRAETGLRLSSSVGATGGMVVAGSLDGDVIALDAGTGAERWRARVTSEVLAAPLPTQGMVVVRSIDGRVTAFDLVNGERRWVFERAAPPLTLRGTSAPVAGQNVVYVGFDDGTLVALRTRDGARVWEQRIAEADGRTELERMADIDGEIQVGLNEVYAASYGGQLMALEAATGRPLWSREIGSYVGTAIGPRHLVAVGTDASVWALDRASSSAMWRQEDLAHRWLTSPAIQGGHVLVGDFEGYLHWLDLESGVLAARVRLGRHPIVATPQVSPEGIAYVVDTHGDLVAYRIDTN